MEYKNSKVTDEILPEGVTQLYQGHIVHADAVGNDVLGQRIAKRLKIDPAVACNILNAYATEFLDAVEAGERPVMEGVFSSRFTCDGAFDAEDDGFDRGVRADLPDDGCEAVARDLGLGGAVNDLAVGVNDCNLVLDLGNDKTKSQCIVSNTKYSEYPAWYQVSGNQNIYQCCINPSLFRTGKFSFLQYIIQT